MTTDSGVWSERHSRIIECLQELYPSWSNVLECVADEAILGDIVLLLAYYFDCDGPNLFINRSSDIGRAQVDSAKIALGAQGGDIPLVINVYRKFSTTPKRERHYWCKQNCIDYTTVSKLDQAYKDLRVSVEGHCGQKIIGNNGMTTREILLEIGHNLLAGNPDALYIHDGRPGLYYLGVKLLDRISISVDSALSVCHSPPQYVILMPCSSKSKAHCSIIFDEVALALSQSKSLMLLLSRAKDKVLKCTKICDCGVNMEESLKSNNSAKLESLHREVSQHCRCNEDEIHITIDPLTRSILLYCQENVLDKAKEVLEEGVKIIKSECEIFSVDVDYPSTQGDHFSYVTAGGVLAQIENQPTSDRSCILWVNSPEYRRRKSDAVLTETYVKDVVLKHLKDVVAVRKFRDFPKSNMWGLVIMKNKMSFREAERFNRIGGKYRLEWLNKDLKEVTLNFSIRKTRKNKIWVTFPTEYDFRAAERFPWNEYWVVETYFFDNNEAKFVFKRDRDDLYLLKNDISRMAAISVLDVKYDTISPFQWPEEDLKFVEDELESKCSRMPYFNSYEIQFLSRRSDDDEWKGIIRFETIHDQVPPQFHTDMYPHLRNNMEYHNKGLLQGFMSDIPRKYYHMISNDIAAQETDFHGNEGLQVDDKGDIVFIHFVWRSGGRLSKTLEDLSTLLKPAVVFGIEKSLGESLRTGCRPFEHIEKYYKVVISLDNSSCQTVLIYGNLENRIRAAEYMKVMLVADGSDKDTTYEVLPLAGPYVPCGLVTTLINRNGPKLDRLKVITGCKSLYLDNVEHRLISEGRACDIERLKEELDTCCTELIGNKWDCQFSRIKECVVCLCPIEDYGNPAYCLSICGHTYCTDCLKSQIKTHVSEKQLPVTCLAENCDTLFSAGDIFVACTKQGIDSDVFVELTLQLHLCRNKQFSRPCPTPDCPVMYQLPVDIHNNMQFECPKCKKITCTGCHGNWHEGLSCDIKKAIDNLDDEQLKSWIEKKPRIRKMCPSCRSGIEKNGGCDNVYCSSCNASICWRCLASFKISSDCYDHMNEYHTEESNNYYDSDGDDLVDYDED